MLYINREEKICSRIIVASQETGIIFVSPTLSNINSVYLSVCVKQAK